MNHQPRQSLLHLRNKRLCSALIVAVSIIGGIALGLVMRHGAGVSPDSYVYADAATNIAAGKPYEMTHYPPGYSFLLAATMVLTGDTSIGAAKALAMAAFAAILALQGLIIVRATQGNLAALLATYALLETCAPLVFNAVWLASEAAYCALLLAGLAGWAHGLAKDSRQWLLTGALCLGFAASIRYVGVMLLPTMVLTMLLLRRQSFWRNLIEGAAFAALAAAPLTVSIIRNALQANSATNRELSFHWVSLDWINSGVSALKAYVLFPLDQIAVNYLVLAAFIAAVATGLRTIYKRKIFHWRDVDFGVNYALVALFHGVIYVAFLATSTTFFDAGTPFDLRLALPAMLPMFSAVVWLLWKCAVTSRQAWAWPISLAAVLLIAGLNAKPALSHLKLIHDQGVGYENPVWKNPQLEQLATLPEDTIIYTTTPNPWRRHYQRAPQRLPWRTNPYSLQANPDFEPTLRQIKSEVLAGRAVVAFIHDVPWSEFRANQADLEQLGLPILSSSDIMTVYAITGQ